MVSVFSNLVRRRRLFLQCPKGFFFTTFFFLIKKFYFIFSHGINFSFLFFFAFLEAGRYYVEGQTEKLIRD